MNKTPQLAIVVPCYNEEDIIDDTVFKLIAILSLLVSKKKITYDSFICFVDDGSLDATWSLIEKHKSQNKCVRGLKLAGNVGHQNALVAGLMANKDIIDCIISIDADLQDDILMIEQMVDKYLKGSDIVYGVRKDRKTDTFFKKKSASIFYRMMNFFGVKIVYNHADYRLTSRRVLDAFSQFEEKNLFLRGIFPLMGFKSDFVYYARLERVAGESKYPINKMISFAWNGITSFSVVPLRLISLLGFFIFIISMACLLWIIAAKFIWGNVVPGWASTLLPIYFLGGVQLLAIGTIGEYLGKIYLEVKNRPRYIIEKGENNDE